MGCYYTYYVEYPIPFGDGGCVEEVLSKFKIDWIIWLTWELAGFDFVVFLFTGATTEFEFDTTFPLRPYCYFFTIYEVDGVITYWRGGFLT